MPVAAPSGQAVPPRARQPGTQAAADAVVAHGGDRRGRVALSASTRLSRAARLRADGAGADGHAHHGQRQRSGCRGAKCWRCSTACAARTWSRSTSKPGGRSCWRRRGSPTRRSAACFPARSSVVIAERQPIGIGRIGDGLYLIDRSGRRHRRVRPELRRARPADHRRPVGGDRATRACSSTRQRCAGRTRARRAAAPARPGGAVSQIDVSDLRDAVVILKDDTALVRLGDDAVRRAAPVVSRPGARAARAGAARSTTSICGSASACTCRAASDGSDSVNATSAGGAEWRVESDMSSGSTSARRPSAASSARASTTAA